MLSVLLGSQNAERVLQYLLAKEQGYLKEISVFYDVAPSILKKQVDKFENAGVIIGTSVGRTRILKLNKRYPFYKELEALLKKARISYPEEKQEDLLSKDRIRFRKKDKPLSYRDDENA